MTKRILAVDDEINILNPLREMLQEEGYVVDIATNGQKGLEAFLKARSSEPYDLVLLDIVMPKMSGLEVLHAIREEERKKQTKSFQAIVPVFMLSGLRDSWMRDAFKDGCSDYLPKPYDVQILLQKIRDRIGS